MSDRRRLNGPTNVTCPPTYDGDLIMQSSRKRDYSEPRPFYLKTGVTPSASGSAYFEIQESLASTDSGMKLICTVHGPRSLPRSAPFSPHMVLSTHVKFAPFASWRRRGYIRDASERDLSIHLETALRGAVIADRWPKSGVDVVVTVIEGDVTRENIDEELEDWGIMTVLSGCITVASAAIADAGIDCVDTVTGGVAALVMNNHADDPIVVLDPVVSEHKAILAACCVAFLPSRDETTTLWHKGFLNPSDPTTRRSLVASAILASRGSIGAISSSLVEALPQAGFLGPVS